MKRRTIEDIMTSAVVTVAPAATYHDIVDAMAAGRFSALPVVDVNGFVVGVVSEADLLHKVEFAGTMPAHTLIAGRRARRRRMKANAVIAADLMTTPPVTVRSTGTICDAAALMSRHQVKRLPVVERANRLVGIVSRSDVLRLHVRPDAQILEEIRTRVLWDTLWIHPDSLTVAVRHGVATLTGTVDRCSTASILVQLVSGVPGVIQVVDRVSYGFDDTRRRPVRTFVSPLGPTLSV
jgi:CBS domain-containing protein